MGQFDLPCAQDTGPNPTRLYVLWLQQPLARWAERGVGSNAGGTLGFKGCEWGLGDTVPKAGNAWYSPREAWAGEHKVPFDSVTKSLVPGKTPKTAKMQILIPTLYDGVTMAAFLWGISQYRAECLDIAEGILL